MLNDRPGDSRSHDILHHGTVVFGPAIDTLVREIAPHINPGERDRFIDLIESWPLEPDGTVRDPDALRARLLALRDTSGAPPRDTSGAPPRDTSGAPPRDASDAPPRDTFSAPSRPKPRLEPIDVPTPPPLPPRRAGSQLAALAGLLIGGFVGLALGILAWLVLRLSVIPAYLWSDTELMTTVVAAVAIFSALVFALQGGRPTRIGHTLVIALLGCFVGGLVVGLAAGLLALAVAAMMGRPAFGEGLFLLIAYGLVPLAATIGGALVAGWTARRAWRDWLG